MTKIVLFILFTFLIPISSCTKNRINNQNDSQPSASSSSLLSNSETIAENTEDKPTVNLKPSYLNDNTFIPTPLSIFGIEGEIPYPSKKEPVIIKDTFDNYLYIFNVKIPNYFLLEAISPNGKKYQRYSTEEGVRINSNNNDKYIAFNFKIHCGLPKGLWTFRVIKDSKIIFASPLYLDMYRLTISHEESPNPFSISTSSGFKYFDNIYINGLERPNIIIKYCYSFHYMEINEGEDDINLLPMYIGKIKTDEKGYYKIKSKIPNNLPFGEYHFLTYYNKLDLHKYDGWFSIEK